jgi:2-polyprenyl-3-methyl-5-hydroxy-6-metoxy-1,4-benzoquinol methylase
LAGQHYPVADIEWQTDELEWIQNNEREWIEFCRLLPSQYQIQLLKRLIDKVELDETIVYLSGLFTTHQEGFKLFFLPWNQRMVKLIENKALVSHGTTGLSTWGASLYLIEYFAQNPYIKGKAVLELGAGLGLLSIAMADIGAKVIATDCSLVMERLTKNCQLNSAALTVTELDWNNPTIQFVGDYIVCADVVFDPDLIPPLVQTIKTYLGPKMQCIMACTKRNEETWALLECELSHHFGIQYASVDTSWFVYSEKSPIFILLLTNKEL